jgi:hypothetical protein
VISVMTTVPLDGPVTDRLTAAERLLAAALELRQAAMHVYAAIKDDESPGWDHRRKIGALTHEAYAAVQLAERELAHARRATNDNTRSDDSE